MAIVINGSGTVTGLAVGGLPDGTVDAGTLATDSVSLTEMASGTDGNIISYDASGNPVAIATGSDGQVLTSTGAGSPPAFEALPGGGLTEADQWRITSNLGLNNDALTWVTANWERADTYGAGKLGTGMTQSSGSFTFPSTGLWMILLQTKVGGTGDARYIYATINTTTNNSTYYEASSAVTSINDASSTWYNSQNCNFIFDVTNTSTHKVKMKMFSITNNISLFGSTNEQLSGLTFIKLGET